MKHNSYTVKFVGVDVAAMPSVLNSLEDIMRARLKGEGYECISTTRYTDIRGVFVMASLGYNDSEGETDGQPDDLRYSHV